MLVRTLHRELYLSDECLVSYKTNRCGDVSHPIEKLVHLYPSTSNAGDLLNSGMEFWLQIEKLIELMKELHIEANTSFPSCTFVFVDKKGYSSA